jgi:hypothetical protein
MQKIYSDLVSEVDGGRRKFTFGESHAEIFLTPNTKKRPFKKNNQSSLKKQSSVINSALVWGI